LSGKLPFDGKNEVEIAQNVTAGKFNMSEGLVFVVVLVVLARVFFAAVFVLIFVLAVVFVFSLVFIWSCFVFVFVEGHWSHVSEEAKEFVHSLLRRYV
jgi:hypothetical protein